MPAGTTPAQVLQGEQVAPGDPSVAIDAAAFDAADGYQAMAPVVTTDGAVYMWGADEWGRLGTGSRTTTSTLARVALPAGLQVAAFALGSGHTLAVSTTGQVYAWGENSQGSWVTGP